MVLVCFRNPERARRIGEGFGDYTVSLTANTVLDDAKMLQPSLVLLDVYAGDNEKRAVDYIRPLSRIAPVVLAAVVTEPAVVAQATAAGAAGVVFRYSPTIVADATFAVEQARRERAAVRAGLRSRARH